VPGGSLFFEQYFKKLLVSLQMTPRSLNINIYMLLIGGIQMATILIVDDAKFLRETLKNIIRETSIRNFW